MHQLEQLRLATAVTHVVPAAELRLRCRRGEEVVVSRHPAADLNPCAMRQVVINARRTPSARRALPASQVTDVIVGGSLEDLGGGVLRSMTLCGIEQRWLASTLPWRVVASALEQCSVPGYDDDALHATIKPDEDLGVTVLGLTGGSDLPSEVLDLVASDVAGSLLAEELIRHSIDEHVATSREFDR